MATCARRRFVVLAAFMILAGSGAGVCAQSPLAIVQFNALIGPATAIRVSSDVLTLDPWGAGFDGSAVEQAIDFRAASRTSSGGEVVLTVEPLVPLDELSGGGAADGVTTISFEAAGDGARGGTLRDDGPQTVGRWVGSGIRTGRVTFAVHGPINPLGVTIPLRFVLTSP